MNLTNEFSLNRRAFLGRAATGLGALALGSLLNPRLLGAALPTEDKWPGVVRPLHWPAKAGQ